jgi:hypothetical protein
MTALTGHRARYRRWHWPVPARSPQRALRSAPDRGRGDLGSQPAQLGRLGRGRLGRGGSCAPTAGTAASSGASSPTWRSTSARPSARRTPSSPTSDAAAVTGTSSPALGASSGRRGEHGRQLAELVLNLGRPGARRPGARPPLPIATTAAPSPASAHREPAGVQLSPAAGHDDRPRPPDQPRATTAASSPAGVLAAHAASSPAVIVVDPRRRPASHPDAAEPPRARGRRADYAWIR